MSHLGLKDKCLQTVCSRGHSQKKKKDRKERKKNVALSLACFCIASVAYFREGVLFRLLRFSGFDVDYRFWYSSLHFEGLLLRLKQKEGEGKEEINYTIFCALGAWV